jgi:hypothetical protein
MELLQVLGRRYRSGHKKTVLRPRGDSRLQIPEFLDKRDYLGDISAISSIFPGAIGNINIDTFDPLSLEKGYDELSPVHGGCPCSKAQF